MKRKQQGLKVMFRLGLQVRYHCPKRGKGFFFVCVVGGRDPYKGLEDLEQQLDLHRTRFPARL